MSRLKVTAVFCYKTSDGKEFASEAEVREHVARHQLLEIAEMHDGGFGSCLGFFADTALKYRSQVMAILAELEVPGRQK